MVVVQVDGLSGQKLERVVHEYMHPIASSIKLTQTEAACFVEADYAKAMRVALSMAEDG